MADGSLTPARSVMKTPQAWINWLSKYGIFLLLVVLVVALSIITPLVRGEQYFLTPRNLTQVMLQGSINGIIALGMTFIITSGGIDLSVGSIVALAGVIAASVMALGSGPWIGLLAAVATGMLCGLFNGFLITRIKLQPFIATLGTMGIFRGLTLILSDGRPIYGFDSAFVDIFSQRVFGEIPLPVIVVALLAVICWLVLAKTRFGKYVIAIGSSEESVMRAGISIRRYKLGIYTFGGVLTGISAALLTARLSSADPTSGTMFELDAIAATVMGGTSLSGGEGTIAGTIVGALIISIIRNALNILNIPSFWQQFVIGAVIIVAVALDQVRRRYAQRVG